ncbi:MULTISPECIES: filamentous hemagglutinin N-terminal domain-containing protein [Trichocoleus]|uniref:Filamentous hemagglutinin N-terminal domain-containing protein n=1 Tax=Trichocoleus desertorum GB2-A4 TaxID=2933944 RepID=A0ABV0JGE5_9CYAN|nr:filamentous hemagglutinin N-terminal domain-containing protein [Trichocoleus sp. FACHB-46]MBD1865009.1 filamentous hemagglutinin N-terminal domain-containing protein [Trichocoleus sp. FACHB-46]
MHWLKLLSSSVFTVGLATVLADSAPAQITSGENGTLVNLSGGTINITGGTQTGSNLFHSFGQFSVDAGQTANFVDPGVQNILGRVTGGNASLINGVLQITAGNANLYLMNPAGIIFGSGASLDVSGSFTATTANGIGFGDQWFNAIAANDYANLIGNPTSFAFTMAQPGAIANAGNLVVGQGHSIALLGGTVINTGILTAPEGKVTVAAVPGEKIVNISQDGSLLSLSLPETTGATVQALPFTPLSLPQLLTGGNLSNATGVTVENGVVRLVGSGIHIEAGDVVATGITAQTATLSASNNLTLLESQLYTTGALNLLAQNTVQIRDSAAKPVIVEAGGNLTIQGNQAVDILALNHVDSRLVASGNLVLRSSQTISSDAHYFTGGYLKFEQLDGNPGNVFSFYDPIILAAGDITLGNYTGASLHILAGGSVTLGDVEITQAGDAATTINPNNTAAFNATQTFADLATVTRADGSPLQYNGTPVLDSDNTLQWIDPTTLFIDGSARPTLDVRAGIDWSQLGGVPAVLGVPTDIVQPPHCPTLLLPISLFLQLQRVPTLPLAELQSILERAPRILEVWCC